MSLAATPLVPIITESVSLATGLLVAVASNNSTAGVRAYLMMKALFSPQHPIPLLPGVSVPLEPEDVLY